MKNYLIYMPRIFLTAITFMFTFSIGTAINTFPTLAANPTPQNTSSSGTVTVNKTDRHMKVANIHTKKARNKIKKAAKLKKIKKAAKKKAKAAKKKAGAAAAAAKKKADAASKAAKTTTKAVGKAAKSTGKVVGKAAKSTGKAVGKAGIVAAEFAAKCAKVKNKKARRRCARQANNAVQAVKMQTLALGETVGSFVVDQISLYGCMGFAQMLKSPKIANKMVKQLHPILKKSMSKIAKDAGLASANPLYFDNFKGDPGHYGLRKLTSFSTINAQPNFRFLQYAAASEPVVMSDAVGMEVAALKTGKIYKAAIKELEKQAKNIAELTRLTGVMAKNTGKMMAKFLDPNFLCNSTGKEKQKVLEGLGLKPKIKLAYNEFSRELDYADTSSGSFFDKFSLISEAQAKRKRRGKKKKKNSMWHGFQVGVSAEAVQGVGLGFLFITDWNGKHHGFFFMERTISAGLEAPVGVGTGVRTFFFAPSKVSGFEGKGYSVGIAAGAKALAKAEVGIDVSLASDLQFAGVGAGVSVGLEAATGPSAAGTLAAGYTIKMY